MLLSLSLSLVLRRRLDDMRAVDVYVRLVSTLDREVDGDFVVSTQSGVVAEKQNESPPRP